MPFCSECGKQIKDNDKFCSSCGNKSVTEGQVNSVNTIHKKKTSTFTWFVLFSILACLTYAIRANPSKKIGDVEYSIVSTTDRIDGSGIDADVLIESFSRNTPISERNRVSLEIAKKESFDIVRLYSTMDAQKAMWSSSFAESHPNALKTGYLGSLEKSKFTAGEVDNP